jgi:septal ring factor EnvC (AmiA/AmiB activator)
MAQDTIDKIINIQFNYGELVQGWQKATREIEINKKNLAELKQEYKNGEMSASEYNRALLEITSTTKALTAEKKAYEKEIQSNIKIESQEMGSLNQLRASLQKMTAQYNAMSAARREGQEGRLLAASIKSQQEAINEAEQALGNYRSQVGNYENAVRNALPFGNSFLLQLSESAQQAGGMTNMVKGASAAVGSLVKQAAAFIATPLGVTIAAIYASYKWMSFYLGEVNDRIQENERLTYKQRETLTAAEAWNAAYTNSIDRMAESMVNAQSKAKTFWTMMKIYLKDTFKYGIAGGLNTLAFGGQAAEVGELKAIYDQIAAKERELNTARRNSYEELAKLETKIAEDRLKSNDRRAYSDKQRRQFALDAIKATETRYAIIKDIASKELELEELRASTTENSIETNDKLAQMRAGIIRLEAQETNSLRELQERLNETSDKAKQSAKTQLDLEKQLSKSILELRQASLEKDLELSRLRFSWERQELENKLKYDKTLTAESREAINKLILNMEERRYKEESEIRQRWSDKEFEEEARNAENRIKMRIKVQEEMDKLSLAQVKNKNYSDLIGDDKDARIKAQQAVANEELRIAQSKYDAISQMDEEQWSAQYGSIQAYEMARLDAENNVQDAIKKTTDLSIASQRQAIKMQQDELTAASSLVGSLRGLFGALGDDLEAFAIAEQALAVVQIIIDAQKATLAALAQSFSLGPIAGPIWFTTQKGIIAAQAAIATATTLAQSIPSFFSEGGLVTGPGTETSDSIPAMLSNGEAVMTAQAVNDWGAMLSAMNVASGGNAIQVSNLPQRNDGMRGMKAMIREAMLEMPAPIVSVVDINKGQKRVKVQNSLGKLGRKKYK